MKTGYETQEKQRFSSFTHSHFDDGGGGRGGEVDIYILRILAIEI